MAFSNIKNDFLASLVSFLVVVPICLGVAVASNAPAASGIISCMIGAFIIGFISESKLSISTPTSSVMAVLLAAAASLGGYPELLCAIVLAGVFQMLFGFFRLGMIANYIPVIVIKGLLCAIGVLIIIKQLPVVIGYSMDLNKIYQVIHIENSASHLRDFAIPEMHLNISCIIISAISLFILTSWHRVKHKKLSQVPATCIAVLVAVVINYIWMKVSPQLYLPKEYLVSFPISDSITDIGLGKNHPKLSTLYNPDVYFFAMMIAMVTSLETLLNLEGVEKLDKNHRYSSRNRELAAQGIANIVCGIFGGIPLTVSIVSSSLNITSGAKTKLSSFFLGVLLLLSLWILDDWLRFIPMPVLAAILLHTGYTLIKPKSFKAIYMQGYTYLIPFILTVLFIVFTNILLGVIVGLVASVGFILKQHSKNCFTVYNEKRLYAKVHRYVLPQHVTFLNRAAIIQELNHIPHNSKIIIDARYAEYIDDDIIEIIKESKAALKEKGILVNLEGFKKHYDIDNLEMFTDVTTHDVQNSLTPNKILLMLKEGNKRFINNTPVHKNYKKEISATSQYQHPLAVIFSCIDSRVPVEVVFDLSLGDVFVARVAGNVVDNNILASVEYACHVAGAKLIIVLGHKNCGAIQSACQHFMSDKLKGVIPPKNHIIGLLEKVKPAIDIVRKQFGSKISKFFVEKVTKQHVLLTKDDIYSRSSVLRTLVDDGKVQIVGAFYDIETGKVDFNLKNTDHEE